MPESLCPVSLRKRPLVLLGLAVVTGLPGTAAAQADRLELGLRLRAFERELDQVDDAARRRDAFRELERAVAAFFRLDTRTVAAAIADATWALRGRQPTAAERHAGSLGLALQARLCATGDGAVACTVDAVYAVSGDGDGDDQTQRPRLRVALQVLVDGAPPLLAAVDQLPLRLELPLRSLPPGDHRLRFSVRQGDQVLYEREQGLSLADGLQARLDRLDARDDGRTDLEGATRTSLLRTLRAMTRPRAEETVLPGERLLREAEELAALPADGRYYGPARTGQFWLRVPVGTQHAVVRLSVPAGLYPERPVPLVIAQHGAGGSENLFCDGYGDGAIVTLCNARGWLCASPRAQGFGGGDPAALADALAARYPIDRRRVFLVGHSMGAMGVVAAAVRTPARFAAVAALGGGGAVRRTAGLESLPFFVAAGSRDFGRAGALALRDQLLGVGSAVQWRDYEDVEHLTVVQIALPDVFAFFDRLAAK